MNEDVRMIRSMLEEMQADASTALERRAHTKALMMAALVAGNHSLPASEFEADQILELVSL